jgi:hypothetical protein
MEKPRSERPSWLLVTLMCVTATVIFIALIMPAIEKISRPEVTVASLNSNFEDQFVKNLHHVKDPQSGKCFVFHQSIPERKLQPLTITPLGEMDCTRLPAKLLDATK